jgi:hypothetical protein
MQANYKELTDHFFPEYYLSWTLQHPEFLRLHWKTSDGRDLEILDLGQANLDNGPDFLQAMIKVDGVVMRGDIEFHLDWRDWYRHGHDSDRRYNQVVLHVLWEVDQEIAPELSRRFPHFIVSHHLQDSVKNWLQKLAKLQDEGDLKPETSPTLNLASSQLEQLAWERFSRKCDEIRQWVTVFDWETAVFLGLAKSLGYSKNSAPFLELVKKMPPKKLLTAIHSLQRSPLIFWTLLAWQSGLLERPFRNTLTSDSDLWYRFIHYVRKQFLPLFPLSRQSVVHWHFARLRPMNNPYFRLAGYSQILFHYQDHSLFQELLQLFCQRKELNCLLAEIEKDLCLPLSTEFSAILVKFLGYQTLPRKTMGRIRCHIFILNILLPLFFVWSQVNKNSGFSWYLEDLFFTFPTVDQNSLLRKLPSSLGSAPDNKAYVQQALLEYHERNFHPPQLIIRKMN